MVTEDVTVSLFECNAGVPEGGTLVSSITTNDGAYNFGPESEYVGGDICLDPSLNYYVQFDFDSSEGASLQGHNFSTNDSTCSVENTMDDISSETGTSNCFDPNDDDANDGDDDNHIDAGINPCQELGGTVFFDLNGNGCQDPEEGPVTDEVTVTLFECSAGSPTGGIEIASTTTINGEYTFGEESLNENAQVCLESGRQYYVDFDFDSSPTSPLSNFVFTNGASNCGNAQNADDVDGTNGISECFNPDDTDDLDGDGDNHIDAGIMPLSKLGDTVFLDCNGDGVQNPTEEGVSGIKVELFDNDDNLIMITTTDANGKYVFDGIFPGDYYVRFINGDFEFTLNGVGGDSTLDSDVDNSNGPGTTALVNLSPGECDISSFDAGLYKCVPIGERVWLDINENDIWDTFENGINGIRVELFKNIDGQWELYDFTLSGHKPGTPSDDGYFKFCVAPGRYYLRFLNPPSALVPAVANFGLNDLIDSDVTGAFGPGTTSEINIACGEERCDVGAGYYKMGSIGDNVWFDDNNNGMRDNNESGVSDVVVRAYDFNGVQFGETTTDDQGQYIIDYLGKNSYYLQFELPNGLAATQAHIGDDDTIDSDVDGSNGPMTTKLFIVSPGEHIPNVDAGVVLGVLSVQWLDIRAENNISHHTVTWDVASQSNVSHYEIERSIDGLDNFVSVDKVLSTGDNPDKVTYTYDDYDVLESGVYYYRIKQVEYNNSDDYSEIVSVDRIETIKVEDNMAMIYPNPVVNELTLELGVTKPIRELVVNMYDAQGRITRRNAIIDIDILPGLKSYRIDVSDIVKGVYSMRIDMGRNVIIKKVIVVD